MSGRSGRRRDRGPETNSSLRTQAESDSPSDVDISPVPAPQSPGDAALSDEGSVQDDESEVEPFVSDPSDLLMHLAVLLDEARAGTRPTDWTTVEVEDHRDDDNEDFADGHLENLVRQFLARRSRPPPPVSHADTEEVTEGLPAAFSSFVEFSKWMRPYVASRHEGFLSIRLAEAEEQEEEEEGEGLRVPSASTDLAGAAAASCSRFSCLEPISYAPECDFRSPKSFITLVSHRHLSNQFHSLQLRLPFLTHRVAVMSSQSKVSYFEVTIHQLNFVDDPYSEGEGAVAIGLERIHCEERMVGWDPGSIGWHSDNGGIYDGFPNLWPRHSESNTFETYGPGDVVGCGIDWESGAVFYTKNGRRVPWEDPLRRKRFVKPKQRWRAGAFGRVRDVWEEEEEEEGESDASVRIDCAKNAPLLGTIVAYADGSSPVIFTVNLGLDMKFPFAWQEMNVGPPRRLFKRVGDAFCDVEVEVEGE